MTSGYFEDIKVGDSRKAGPYFVSKDEIIQFAKQFDPRPFHVDEEAAARSIFGGLTASAGHTFAIFILLTGKYQPPFRALVDWAMMICGCRTQCVPETISISKGLL